MLKLILKWKKRNWHWMWSTFYFNKKHNGYFLALIIISLENFFLHLKNDFLLFNF